MNVSVDKAYDSPSWWYDIRGFFILCGAYQSTLMKQIIFFSGNMQNEHLEVAIGSGSLFAMILRYRRIKKMPTVQVHAIDYAPAMLRGAQWRFKNSKDIHIELMDVGKLSFHDEQFSTINLANSFHSFPDASGAMKEMARVLKPGGMLAMNCLMYPEGNFSGLANKINNWGMRKGILYRPYTQKEVEDLCDKNELKITESWRHGNCLYLRASKTSRK